MVVVVLWWSEEWFLKVFCFSLVVLVISWWVDGIILDVNDVFLELF